MSDGELRPYVLGLDLGVGSIGWALVEIDNDGTERSILRMGTHLFEAGMQGNIAEGKGESKAVPRRSARQIRRQIWRRARRKRKLLLLLQRHGLAPAGNISDPASIDSLMKQWDAELRQTWERESTHSQRQALPYRLRAEAIRRKLEPMELGRALYHLAQRRGFLTNRREAAAKDDDEGAVRSGISELERDMQEAGAKTLGAYFASLDPSKERIRRRWTSRAMYENEYRKIVEMQARHHEIFRNQDFIEELHDTIFYQRPLKSQSHLIGRCSIAPTRRRAPVALRLAQRFRMLGAVNNLTIEFADGRNEALTHEQRQKVIHALERSDKVTFARLRQKSLLGLPKDTTFNLQRGGENALIGLRTDARLAEVFGDRWWNLPEHDKDEIVEDLLTFEKVDALARKGRTKWGLNADAAQEFANLRLEEGHLGLSLWAIRRLLPRLEEGLTVAEAKRDEFPGSFEAKEPLHQLPPVEKAIQDLTNPTVRRALTELRKLVNAIVRRYGKPEHVRIELTRDMKRSQKERQRISKDNRQRQTARERAVQRMLKEARITSPSRTDIEKVLLADECGWTCPYTGRAISMKALVGPEPQFDIEHIWPLDRSLDDSFLNKTLCHHEENRSRKRNRTPFEAYGATDKLWEEMCQRVQAFQGDAARIKLQRFIAEEIPEDRHPDRYLNETRYISRQAAEYLALLFGGLADAEHRRRVHTTTGGLTWWLRREWHLNALFESGVKDRDDHRHHAVDALVVALTTTRTVNALSRAAKEAAERGHRMFAPMDPPWDGFLEEARERFCEIIVSHRQSRRISGAMHKESLYSRPFESADGKSVHRIRKPVESLTRREIESDAIVDPGVREAVRRRLAELGESDPKRAFADVRNQPYLNSKNGQRQPIHRVRVEVRESTRPFGKGARERRAVPGANHHTQIIGIKSHNGRVKKWDDRPITLAEMYGRKDRVSEVNRDPENIAFTLSPNEFVELTDESGRRTISRVLSISKGDIEFVEHFDGRIRKKRVEDNARLRCSPEKLRQMHARKVSVSYLGEVHSAGD